MVIVKVFQRSNRIVYMFISMFMHVYSCTRIKIFCLKYKIKTLEKITRLSDTRIATNKCEIGLFGTVECPAKYVKNNVIKEHRNHTFKNVIIFIEHTNFSDLVALITQYIKCKFGLVGIRNLTSFIFHTVLKFTNDIR